MTDIKILEQILKDQGVDVKTLRKRKLDEIEKIKYLQRSQTALTLIIY